MIGAFAFTGPMLVWALFWTVLVIIALAVKLLLFVVRTIHRHARQDRPYAATSLYGYEPGSPDCLEYLQSKLDATAEAEAAAQRQQRLDGYGWHGPAREQPGGPAPAGLRQGRITLALSTALDRHVRAHGLGAVYPATGFKLADNPAVIGSPDIAFIRQDRLDAVGEVDGYWPGAPDLVVEVVSPDDRYADVEDAVAVWLMAGSRRVLVVNPRQRIITAYRSCTDVTVLTERDTLEGGEEVPGWTLPVRAVFA